jgi:putative SOS response-associated peptidase YedK
MSQSSDDPYAARMPQRLVIPSREEVDAQLTVLHPWWQFSARFNVAISQSIPVARMHDRESEGVMMRWGLAHRSARGTIDFTRCGSIRRDALKSAPDVDRMWTHGQRGIVPLAGFYLWRQTPAGYRQPYYVRLVNREVFGVAVVWDRSVKDDDDVIEGCALVTVPANPLLAEISHPTEQMPAILRREDYEPWLRSSVGPAKERLDTYPQNRMVTHPVGPYVNHLEFDEPRLIQRAP